MSLGTKLKSYISVGTKFIEVDIYGYSSRSVPGLDIIGIGSKGKLIREKITFITNRHIKKKRALKRYAISIESEIAEEKLKLHARDLEFPILILYWSLAGILPIKNLDKIWTTGFLSVDFDITLNHLNEMKKDESILSLVNEKIFVHPREVENDFSMQSLIWEDLLNAAYRNSDAPSNDFG